MKSLIAMTFVVTGPMDLLGLMARHSTWFQEVCAKHPNLGPILAGAALVWVLLACNALKDMSQRSMAKIK